MQGSTAPWFIQKFYYANNLPLNGGKIYFYVAGSTTIPKNIYYDIGLTNAISQPLVLDASGTAPQYFMGAGLYKILVKDSIDNLVNTRDNIQGIATDGIAGGLVLVDSGDTTPDYLANKIQNTNSITWSTINIGGSEILKANVNEEFVTSLADHLVKADSYDVSPGTLVLKITDSLGATFAVSSERVVIPLQNYALLSGNNTFTSHNYFTADISTVDINNAGTVNTNALQAVNAEVSGTASIQAINVANGFVWGQANNGLYPTIISADQFGNFISTQGSPFMVSYDGTDTAQYIGTMLRGGTGVTITPTTVGGLTYMSFSVNTSGLIPSLPATQVALGTGTGLGSSGNLISHGTDLIATGPISGSTLTATTLSNGLVKSVSGLLSTAVPTTDYVIPSNLSAYLNKTTGGTVSGPITLSNASVNITGVTGHGTAGNLVVNTAGLVSISAPSSNINRFAILYSTNGVCDNTIGAGSITCSGDITLGDCSYPNASNGMDVVIVNVSAYSHNIVVPSGYFVIKGGTFYTGPVNIALPNNTPIHLVGITTGGGVGTTWAWL